MDVSPSPLFVLLHSPILLVALLVPIFSFFFLFSTKKKPPPSCSDGGQRLPPSPRGFPIIGHLHLLGSLPHRNLRSLAEAHGPVMLLQLGRVPTVVASSAAAAQEAMKTRDLAFASRAQMRMAELLLYGRDMVLAPYGEYWRQARRVCVVHLLNQRRILSFRRVREQEVSALVDGVRRGSLHPACPVNLSDMFTSYSNAVIKRAAFGDGEYGLDGDEGGEKLRKVLDDFEQLLGTPTMGEFVPWLAWVDTLTGLNARARRTFEALDGLLERVIAAHRQRRLAGGPLVGDGDGEDDERDFVDVLLDVSEAGEEAGGVRFDTISIKAIMLDMFAAATDTTYTTMEWAMAELINHPSEMRKLQNEIRAAVNGAGDVTEDHLGALRYLRAVIRETLRLHAPLPLLLPRETMDDTELLGYRVPARTRVVINAWAIGRDPATWERAEEFVPERFVDDPAEYGAGRDDFRSVPFGAGRRGCPGVGFAVPSMELALANLLYHFDWELPPRADRDGGGEASKLDMSELFGVSVRLKAALHVVARPWSPP